MAENTLGRNIKFQIYNSDGTPFENLVLHKSTVESVVMSLGDKITGDVYYKNNHLEVTMREYIVYNDVKYTLVNPPTILREGLVKDNGDLKGMTKYSFEFYHPMYQLGNFPFSDVAVSSDQQRYLSENKKFSWIGYPDDYIAKLNKNLDSTEWVVEKTNRFPALKNSQLSEVLAFDNNTIAEALKKFYETWEVPYVVSEVSESESYYAQGKRFKVSFGLPSQKIYASESDRQLDRPFVFKMGKGVGLKNNSRTPSNNKIITRIAGYGSEDNIPYGYPQIPYEGIDVPYPLYDGIVGGRVVKLIKHPFTRTHLMPSIYRQTVKQKIYNQSVELKDYYDATGAPYTNLINPSAPCYEIHEFGDIKPEFGEEYIIDAKPINDSDKSIADEWDDTIDSDGNYNQGYFQITLPILSFDLYACAAITQEMQINMRGGACIGCTFTVQVDWDNYKANFYNQDGEFDPEGERRDYEKYPDSRQRSITVIVQKEYQTFGTIMPNVFQQPKNGDQFVFLGISMPSSYIEQAEQRLDDEMRSYMLENNTYHYEYPLKFDEYFLATHQYILEQLKPNSIVRFDFAGQELELFVKQTTIKYGESQLPQYNITLTDNIEIVLNQIGQVADDVEKLSSLVAILRQSYGRNVWVELSKKLSKVSDDTAQGFIRFMKGLQVGEDFVSGLLGEGGVFRKDADGTTYLEADKMYVRMKAYFDTVEIRKFLHSGGNRIASVAGAKCVRVVPFAIYNGSEVALSDDYRYHWTTVDPDTGEEIQHQSAQYSDNPEATNHVEYYRCYFRGSDGDDAVTNDFIIGDQAYCHITNGDTQALQQHQYWRLVLNKSNYTDADGMHYIDLSNHTEDTLVIEGVEYKHAGFQTGSDVPSAQDDIVQLGNIADKTRQGAIIEYVSGEDAPSYQIYQGIDDFSLSGKNYIGIGYNSSTGRAYMNVYGDAYIGDRNGNAYMQYHIVDVPVVDPETGEQVIDEETGKPVYRQEPRLDIKARISVQSTVTGAEGGDQTFEEYINSRSVSKETIMKLIGDDLQAIQNQIDGAIETWFYNGVPSANTLPESEWKATDTKAGNNNERLKHLGDLYYDNKTGRAYRYVNTGTEQAPVFSWTEINDSAVVEALKKAQDAQSTADGKRRVFVVQPTPPYDKGDLWVNATFDNGTIKYDDDILKCVTAKDKNGSFAIADWTLASKYTDDSSLNTFLNGQYKTDLQATRNQIDSKAETWYQSQDPSTAWTTDKLQESHVGDLWYNTTNKKTYIYRDVGASANPRYKWAEAEMDVPQEVFDKIDGKASIYTNTLQNPPTNYKENDLWIIPGDYNINGVDYKNGEVLTATADSVGFNQAHWTKKVRYTDDAKFDGYINQILRGTGASGDSATVANAIKVIKNALNEATVIDGGLVLTSLINLRSNSKTWAGVSGQYDEKEETQGGAKGHGIAAWYGGGMADWEKYKESHPTATITDAYAKSLFRFDGSGYLAGGNITWDASGRVAIKDITTLIGNSDTDILNGLTIFNKAFHFNTQQGDDVTVLSINPQAGFTNLSITSGGVLYPVATQQWVSDNYLSKAFFSRLFQAHNGAADVNPNDTATAITDIEAMFGFWTEKYISALGKNDSSSDVVLNEPLQSINNGVYGTKAAGTAIVWDGSKWVYGKTGGEGTVTAVKVGNTTYSPTNGVVSLPAYPTSLAWGNITGKPTTIGDYGITDAKIENGVITLGTNTITPLTDAKLKSSYEWWGQKMNADGKVNGNITIQLTTVDTNTYADANPKLIFKNANGSQNISLTFTDYDAVAYPASLTLNGNQGNELFIAPRMKADRLYLYKPNGNGDTNAVYLEYDSANGGVHLVGAGFYSDSFVSALGKSDSGSSSVFDEDAMWTALGTNRTNKLIASAYLGNVTKTLTITSGNTTVVYDGTVARSITINDMAAKQLTASTIDGTAGSFFFYGDNLINNQFDWVGIQVDKTSNNSPDRGQLVWDSGSISVRQNDGDSWTDWALVLTNKNYASQIAAGTITNAMLAGSIANSKLANSSVTVNGTTVSLGGSITTSKWGESRNINIASSDGTGASTSVSVDGSAAKTLLLPSTIKASLTGNATSATKLNTGTATYSAWGQTYWNNGVPNGISGDMTSVGNITMSGHVKMDNYKHIEIKNTSGTYLNVLTFTSANQFVLGEGLQSYPTYLRGNTLTLQTGTSNAAALTINASGLVEIVQNTQGLKIGNAYLVWDSANSALKVMGANNAAINFYATGGVSALGMGDSGGGGGVTLNEPLSSINTSSLGSPSGHTNSTMVWNGSSWVWSNSQGVSLGAYNFSAFDGNFNTLAINNKAVATQEWVTNNYIPMCGFVSANANTVGWGTLTPANGYSAAMNINAPDSSSGYFGYKDGQLSFQIDGLFYQNEGKYKVLDTNTAYISGQTITINGTSLTVPTGAGGDYIPLSGSSSITGSLVPANTDNYNLGTQTKKWSNIYTSYLHTYSDFYLDGNDDSHIYANDLKIYSGYSLLLYCTDSDNPITFGTSTYDQGILSYGGFKKSGSSDSYVLLGGGGHKALSEFVVHRNMGQDAMTGYAGSFFFSGDSALQANEDYVGFQAGYNIDKWQMIAGGGSLKWRQNDAGGTDSTSWTGWKLLLDSNNYLSYVLPSSYVTSGSSLSSYWVKAWDITITDRKYDNLNMTILVQSEFDGLRGIICMNIRQEGNNNSGSYNFGVNLTQMAGNIPNDRFRLYYNNSTGKCELWCNVNAQWGVFNFSVLKKCWRVSTDVATMGTFYNTNFSSVQTLPTSASGYAYTVMGSNDASNMKLTNIDAYASNNGVTSTQTATSICVYDKNNLDLSGIQTLVYTNGAIATKWYVRNYTSGGAQATENAITMNMTKSGAVTYVVNNADKFREAIGVNLDNYLPLSGGKLTGDLSEVRPNGGYRLFAGYASGEAARFEALDGNGTWKAKGFTLLQNGNIGINKDNPAQKLDVNGNTRINGNLYILNSSVSSTSAAIRVAQVSGHTWLDVAGADGDYGIYNNGDFHCAGYATFEGGYGSSDIRKKDIVKYVERSVEDIARAPIFDFTWKQKPNKGTHLGTSAQYWQGILPNSVVTSPDGYLAMDYGAVALASAVSVARKVVDHELRIKQLQDRVLELENELEQLKAA